MHELLTQSSGHFVHRINPMLGEIFGVRLWYYGSTYSLGFLGIYLWFKKAQRRLAWPDQDVYDLSILVSLCVLMFGRAFEIVFYEWGYYSRHPGHVLSYWQGGMATHGILLGGVTGVWLFSRIRRMSFLAIVDEIAIPGAFLMAVGRIGNFIDGQILGTVTDAWWAVKFPYAEGFRHPVTLYDSLKNLLMIPLLLAVRRSFPPGRGMLLAHFVFWYGFGRLFVDIFREYPTSFFGVGTGQYFNLLMAGGGLSLMICFTLTRQKIAQREAAAQRKPLRPEVRKGNVRPWDLMSPISPITLGPRRLLFVTLLLFPLVIPTDWTQGNVKTPQEAPPGSEVSHAAQRSQPTCEPRISSRIVKMVANCRRSI